MKNKNNLILRKQKHSDFNKTFTELTSLLTPGKRSLLTEKLLHQGFREVKIKAPVC